MLETQLQHASAVQRRLYPQDAPRVAGFEVAGAVVSADETCGDYFDFLPSADSLLVAIGDVSGHGLAAALVMTQVRAYVRAFAQFHADPGRILDDINELLMPDLREEDFVTLLVARLEPRSGRLWFANAGHLPGQVFQPDGTVRAVLARTGLPIGFETGGYASAEAVLEPGETLVLATDGLTESRTPDGGLLSAEGAARLVRERLAASPGALVAEICERVRSSAPLRDDVAMVAVRSTGARPDAGALDRPGSAADCRNRRGPGLPGPAGAPDPLPAWNAGCDRAPGGPACPSSASSRPRSPSSASRFPIGP